MAMAILDREFARIRQMSGVNTKAATALSSTDTKTNHFVRDLFESFVLLIQAVIDRFSISKIEEDECYITTTGGRVPVRGH